MITEDEKSRHILAHMQDGLITIGKNGRINFCNKQAEQILGMPLQANETLQILNENAHNDAFVDSVIDALQNDGDTVKRCVEYQAPGTETVKTLVLSICRAAEDTGAAVIVLISDITDLKKTRSEKTLAVMMMTMMLTVLCVMTFVYAILSSIWTDRSMVNTRLAALVMYACVILAVVTIVTKVSVKDMDIIPRHNLKYCSQALGISLIIFGGIVCLKLFLQSRGIYLVDPDPLISFTSPIAKKYFLSTYPISVLLQEIAARSIMQNSLEKIYSGKYSGVTSVLVSSLYFGSLHFEFGPVYMVGAAVLMGAFGVFYRKTHNVLATSIIHYGLATSAILVGFAIQ